MDLIMTQEVAARRHVESLQLLERRGTHAGEDGNGRLRQRGNDVVEGDVHESVRLRSA